MLCFCCFCCCSVAWSCPTLCDLRDCSTGFLVHHQLPELAQTHIHCVDDAIQPSHPLSSPSPPAFDLSQHQGLFQWVSLTSLSLFTFMYWRRKWQPTPVFLPGEFQGRRSLVGCIVQSMGLHRVGHDWSDLAAAAVLCIRWPNYWSFSISLSSEYSGLIFFGMD